MKIAILSSLYPPHDAGGPEILCQSTAKSLARRDHETLVLTSRHGLVFGVQYPPELGVERIFEASAPFGGPDDRASKTLSRVGLANKASCRAALETFQPDVAYIWSLDRLTVGPARAVDELRLPAVYSYCDMHLADYLPPALSPHPGRLMQALSDRMRLKGMTADLLRMGRAVCISRALRDSLAAAGIPASHAEVVYPGIEVAHYPLKPDPARLRHPARLLFCGALRPNKKVEIILRALGLLLEDSRASMHLTIAGEGDAGYEASLRHVAEDLGVAGDTMFMGRVEHTMAPQLYRDHDIFVFSSGGDEPFGQTHLEAMASGCPVVSADCGGATEFLRHEQNALVVAKDDPWALADAIRRLLQNAVLRQKLIQNARELIETKFSAQASLEKLEEILRKAVEGR